MPSLVLGPIVRYVDDRVATIWLQTDGPSVVEVLGVRERTWSVDSAIANSRPVYVEPAPVYVAPPPVYAVPPPYDGPICHIERQQVWDGYAYRTRRIPGLRLI